MELGGKRMVNEINKLFDLNGDGKLDGIELALAYYVMFGDDEEQGSDDLDYEINKDDEEE